MAPTVIRNSETIINNSLEVIAADNGHLINNLVALDPVNKTCPIEHLNYTVNNGVENGSVDKSFLNGGEKAEKKFTRRVIKPKVLKNHESKDYLYDRLYDDTCPRAVSIFGFVILFILCKINLG